MESALSVEKGKVVYLCKKGWKNKAVYPVTITTADRHIRWCLIYADCYGNIWLLVLIFVISSP